MKERTEDAFEYECFTWGKAAFGGRKKEKRSSVKLSRLQGEEDVGGKRKCVFSLRRKKNIFLLSKREWGR